MTAHAKAFGQDNLNTRSMNSGWNSLYILGGVAALAALTANFLDVALGFGEPNILVNGSKTAVEWFALFQENGFKGLYTLGIMNIVYMAAMVPVYFATFMAHQGSHRVYTGLVMTVAFLGMAIYLSNNAAIPMAVLSGRYAAAGTDAQRAVFAAAGEAVLARGEDFTPGAFTGLVLGGIASIGIACIMLRGGIFGKANAWIGITGFTFLAIFTLWSTFIPVLYEVAFYFFGGIGGLLALVWFALTARRLFQLGAHPA